MNKSPKSNIDVCILTDSSHVDIGKNDLHYQSILVEDELVRKNLEQRGLKVHRCSWDDPHFDWTRTAFILFRTTWDYFDRFPEFSAWLEKVKPLTSMINPYEIIKWNLDKHYLLDLAGSGINIPPTLFLEKGEAGSLSEKVATKTWKEIILKPVVSGAARHTYRFLPENAGQHEKVYQELIRNEAMMIQEFQVQVPIKGEVAFIVIDRDFSHAILKKAREGEFRVQDDYGGSVQVYKPSNEEIKFAEKVVKRCGYDPLYARVDVLWDNQGKLSLSELELIEPELWFRFHPESAGKFADAILQRYFNN